jgi:hypothetical protein
VSTAIYHEVSWERMGHAVENVRRHLLRAAQALVRMKLTAFRDKDRVHLRDLIGVGLVDDGWLLRVPTALRPRLQELLDTPEG